MKVPYKEIFKLKVMLDKENIPYEFNDTHDNAYSGGTPFIHYQIIVKKPNSDERLISVIEGNGTYGSNQDLLEIMGCLTKEEEKEDSVKGYLTAEEVLKRIKANLNVNKNKVTLKDLEQNFIHER